MIYSQEQMKDHVKELQHYLNGIAKHNPNMDSIEADGVLNEETKTSIKKFCSEYGLPGKEEVDQATWNKIVEMYNKLTSEAQQYEEIDVFPSRDYVIKPGDVNMLVALLQVMLQTYGIRFQNLPKVSVTGIYDRSTEEAVKSIQNISELDITGDVDLKTWDRIVSLYNQLEIKSLQSPESIAQAKVAPAQYPY